MWLLGLLLCLLCLLLLLLLRLLHLAAGASCCCLRLPLLWLCGWATAGGRVWHTLLQQTKKPAWHEPPVASKQLQRKENNCKNGII